VSEEKERLVAEIPPELKTLVDADQRTNKEVVEAALWREFGGERLGSLERRIEEKKDRVNMIEREKNERKRELKQEQEELEALQAKREAVKEAETEEQHRQEQLWSEAKSVLEVEEIGGTKVVTTEERFLHEWADKLDVTVDELKTEIVARSDN
jgi:chromosome segregation ATPase